jgi:membrane-associated protease RseP (regulator of RpoE activity)
VTVAIGGRLMSLLIDSGSTDFLSVPDGAVEGLSFRSAPRVTGRFMTIAGPVASTQARLAGNVAWGRHRLAEPVVTLTPGSEGSCGTGLLGAFRTTLDATNRRVRFERSSTAPVTCRPVRSPGFGVLRGAAPWTVAYVLDDTPAAAAGLREGDRIATVDGLPVAQLGSMLYEVIVATSASLRLGVVGPDGTREVVVPVVTLIE